MWMDWHRFSLFCRFGGLGDRCARQERLYRDLCLHRYWSAVFIIIICCHIGAVWVLGPELMRQFRSFLKSLELHHSCDDIGHFSWWWNLFLLNASLWVVLIEWSVLISLLTLTWAKNSIKVCFPILNTLYFMPNLQKYTDLIRLTTVEPNKR